MKKVSFTIVLLIMGLINIIAQNAPKSGPCPGMPQFTDPRDGKTYNTVQIGDRCWMQENLNVGTRINSSEDQSDNDIIEKYCVGNNESGCNTYGGLYQWNEIMKYAELPSQKQGLPPGWDFAINPTSMVIAIPLTSNPNINGIPLEPGDYIGAFYVNDEGNQTCGGCVEWNGNQLIALVTFGNDTLWGSKIGFWEGELIRYKVYSWSMQMEFDASVTCASGSICQNFINGGLSVVESLDAFGTIPTVGQGICPPGWLVPTDEEWCALATYLDPAVNCNGVGFIGTNAAGQLKETGTSHWLAPNSGATNESGFTGLPGGYYSGIGHSFQNIGCFGYFHTASTNGSGQQGRWVWLLSSDDERVSRISFTPGGGYSLRCIRDESAVAQLSVTPENQDVSEIAGTTTFEVTSNTSWEVTETTDWLTVTPTNGNLNQTLTVNYDANTTTLTRIGEITITAAGGNPVVVVTVTQQGQQAWACGQPFSDNRDGQTYTTVQIGNQCWMAQNLNVGTKIDGINEQSNNGTIEKYCYDNLETNCDVYGGLYQWDEIMGYNTTLGAQGLCPEGWHLPTDTEWTALTTYLGGENVAGGKMKETGTTYWYDPNTGATNSSGFTALPGGMRDNYYNGTFTSIGFVGNFWSSTMWFNNEAWSLGLGNFDSSVQRGTAYKHFGLSVRCIHDESQLSVTPSNQDVTPFAGITTFEVISNTSWTVSENSDWLTVTPTNGNLNQTLNVNYDAYPSTSTRTGVITISTADGTPVVNVTITQNGTLAWVCGQSITDTRDGKMYTSVQIGTQCWMKQNLNIGTRVDGLIEQSNNGTIEKYCYDNLESNCTTYGGLYQWNEMMGYNTTAGVQGICPVGWHLPTDAEWTTLTNYVSSQINWLCNSNTGHIAISLAATINWNISNLNTCAVGYDLSANNATGFRALPGGFSDYYDGTFNMIGYYGNWWSSTELSADYSLRHYLIWDEAIVYRDGNDKGYGFSVRCLKD